jgi:hypothetical protein
LEFTENDVEMAHQDTSDWIDEDELDATLTAAPPGEEGFFISHAGGEASLQQLFVDSLAERYVDTEIPHNAECSDHSYRKRHDFRKRQDRVERRMYQWQSQLPDLVDAYLQYQAHGPGMCHGEVDMPGQWHLKVIDFASTFLIQSFLIRTCH